MSRRTAREEAVKLLYQIQVNKNDIKDQIEERILSLKLKKNNSDYLKDVVNGAYDKTDYIDSLIKEFSKSWAVERLPKVDLAILRLSIYEILYMPDIPLSVSINEAVEISKIYCSDESGAFINGILSKISSAYAKGG